MNTLLELFDELCDLDTDAMLARLQQIQAEDATLANQLRAMLKADGKATELIARDVEQQLQLGAELWRPSAKPGDFGPYRLLHELGAGGMGVVYLAERQLESTTQLVALKFVRQTNNPELLKHFARERDTLAKLEHPNIARLIDAGTHPDGLPFIATEYVEGVALLDYVRQAKIDLPARLVLVESLCAALDYAHRRLVVHRDIKPSNVMVDHNGQLRLLDFGIAKVLATGDTTHSNSIRITNPYAKMHKAGPSGSAGVQTASLPHGVGGFV